METTVDNVARHGPRQSDEPSDELILAWSYIVIVSDYGFGEEQM